MSNLISIQLDLTTPKQNNISPYEVYVWCAKHFGTENITWRRIVAGVRPKFTFVNEKDAMLFALRWK